MKFNKYTKEELIKAVANSTSLRQVLIKLNVAPYGGNYQVIKRYINLLNLDISHFSGQAHNKGKILGPKTSLDDIFSNKIRITSHKLRLRLLNEAIFQHECQNCFNSTWLNKPIPLELHHKDGNNLNNCLDNLQLLCPNCHALTSNYRGKNKLSQS